jgi:hypothetical protein
MWLLYNSNPKGKTKNKIKYICIFNLNNIEHYTIINDMQIGLNPENNK